MKYYFNTSNRQNSFAQDENLLKGSIAFGVYTSDGKLIDNGSIIKKDDRIQHIVELSQNINAERDYTLLVFIDYVQISFYVDGNKYMNYDFHLLEKDTKQMHVEIELPEKDVYELSYIFIKNPDYKVRDKEFERAHVVQEVLPLRYFFNQPQNDSLQLSFFSDFSISEEKVLDEVFVSTDENILKIPTEVKKGEELYVVLGNFNLQSINYGIVLLENWSQKTLNNEKYLIVNLCGNERVFFRLPDSLFKVGKNYQVLVFPYPYNGNSNNQDSLNIYASHRFNIIK